jgi:hypothetical protein
MIAGMRAGRHFVVSRSTVVLRMREPEFPVTVTAYFVLGCPPQPPPPALLVPPPPQDEVTMRRTSTNMEPTAPR